MVIFHDGEHARAAVDSGRAIHARAAEIGAELSAALRAARDAVGYNSGPGAAGRDQDRGPRRYALDLQASGMTTNIAARLAARPTAARS